MYIIVRMSITFGQGSCVGKTFCVEFDIMESITTKTGVICTVRSSARNNQPFVDFDIDITVPDSMPQKLSKEITFMYSGTKRVSGCNVELHDECEVESYVFSENAKTFRIHLPPVTSRIVFWFSHSV